MSEMDYLRFATANVGYVIDGIEDVTVRYDFDREFEPGQTVQLRTQGNNVFAYAHIEDIYSASVCHVMLDAVATDGRYHPADGTIDLVQRLREHYDTDEIGVDTQVTVIYFDVFQVGGPHPNP